jgi:hypothetical protein
VTRSSEGDQGGISWQHDGTVAAMMEEEKVHLMGRGAPFKGRTRRWPRATETVGGTAGGSSR